MGFCHLWLFRFYPLYVIVYVVVFVEVVVEFVFAGEEFKGDPVGICFGGEFFAGFRVGDFILVCVDQE